MHIEKDHLFLTFERINTLVNTFHKIEKELMLPNINISDEHLATILISLTDQLVKMIKDYNKDTTKF